MTRLRTAFTVIAASALGAFALILADAIVRAAQSPGAF